MPTTPRSNARIHRCPRTPIRAKAKLNLLFKRICEKAKRFYEIAAFFQYAIADGIHHLLFALRAGPHLAQLPRSKGQLVFDFLKPLF
ncbi:MAG: hypothetical protein ABSA67_19015 [Candidatus Brocadiia bacterium]